MGVQVPSPAPLVNKNQFILELIFYCSIFCIGFSFSGILTIYTPTSLLELFLTKFPLPSVFGPFGSITALILSSANFNIATQTDDYI